MLVGIVRLERRKETIGRYYLDSKCDVYMCLKCFFFFFLASFVRADSNKIVNPLEKLIK